MQSRITFDTQLKIALMKYNEVLHDYMYMLLIIVLIYPVSRFLAMRAIRQLTMLLSFNRTPVVQYILSRKTKLSSKLVTSQSVFGGSKCTVYLD